MRKAVLFIGKGSRQEQENIERKLNVYAEQAQLEVSGVVHGNFFDMNALKISLMNFKQMEAHVMLVDSIESLLPMLDIGELHQALKENEMSCYCIENNLLLGINSRIEMKPHKRKAWLMTNGQDGALDKLKQYAKDHELDIVCVNEEKICCDYATLEARMLQMFQDKTEVILVPDDTVFNDRSEDPSLHTMTKLAIDYDIDIVITDINLNICELIKDTQDIFDMITEQKKQYAAVICTIPDNKDRDVSLHMMEHVNGKNYIMKYFCEIMDAQVRDELIDNVIDQNVDLLIMNKGAVLSEGQKERLEHNDIKVEEVEIQEHRQSRDHTQQFQA